MLLEEGVCYDQCIFLAKLLSESNSVWLQYSLTNKGRSQIPPIENNKNPQKEKNPFCILLRPTLVCYEAWARP